MALEPMPCPVYNCKFLAVSNYEGKMLTKKDYEEDLEQQEDALKVHYQGAHADLMDLGIGLTADQNGRLACELKDTMINQLLVFTLANKQQVSKF